MALDRKADGSFTLAGSFPMHDVVDLGIDLPEGGYATVAGLVLDRLGHLAAGGEVVDVKGWRIELVETEAGPSRACGSSRSGGRAPEGAGT